jgi:hypothetical protein
VHLNVAVLNQVKLVRFSRWLPFGYHYFSSVNFKQCHLINQLFVHFLVQLVRECRKKAEES